LNCPAIVVLCENARVPACAHCVLAYGQWLAVTAPWNRTHCTTFKERIMGKYFLAWILGVPAIVLVLIYMFFH
jgi:hypothetical protein